MTDKLHNHIQKKFGRPVNSPKDCELLSQEIILQTKRSISPTTLRRFFGLLHSSTRISAYNLDTLSIYAGAEDYHAFSRKNNQNQQDSANEYHELEEEISKLTEYALNSISRRSLIPFANTIPREDLNRKLDHFIHSDSSFFPLIAPGGYGKSVALSHWVQNNRDSFQLLFCPASIFYSLITGNKDIPNRIQLSLSSGENLFNTLFQNNDPGPKKLVIVIDALDETANEIEKLYELSDYLLDVINLYKESVKFIISVRESVWNSYLVTKFEASKPGSWFDKTETLLEKGYTNMPLLSNSEIKWILSINSIEDDKLLLYECVAWDIRELLRIPLNMYFIIELLSNEKEIVQLSHKDLTKEYLKKFVFDSRFAEQKEDIIWTLFEIMETEKESQAVPKNELKKYYPVHLKREGEYYNAYHELLQNGILIEERAVNKYGVYISKLAFRHQNFFYYLLSLYFIKKNNGLDKKLIFSLAHLKRTDLQKNNLIALLYENAYDNEDYSALEDFCSLPEEIIASLPVRIAVGTSFRRKNRIRDQLIRNFAASKDGRCFFFEQFVDTNYMVNNFKFRIQEYLKYESEAEAKLFGNCILFLAGFLKMNEKECSEHIKIIREIEPDASFYPWPTGRKVASHIMYACFIEAKDQPGLPGFIQKYASMAWSYPGYLKKGIIEFEMAVMAALVLTQKFDILKLILEDSFKAYNLNTQNNNPPEFLQKSQNSIPVCFYEYARFKLGNKPDTEFPVIWEEALTNYSPTFDDYMYLILINWFLCDFHFSKGNKREALNYYYTALELSKFADYDFFIAFLSVNDPLKRPDYYSLAEKMVAKSGFIMDKFIFR